MLKRLYVSALGLGVFALVSTSAALASGPSAPTVSTSDLIPVVYAVAAAILAGVLGILSATILAKIPFAIVNIVRRAIHKLMGSAKPAAG